MALCQSSPSLSLFASTMLNRFPVKSLFVLLSITLLSSCQTDISPTFSIRSGPVDNDDVEDPLPEIAKEFEAALSLSNKILDLAAAGQSAEIYNRYSDSQIKNAISKEEFEKLISSAESDGGKRISYKPMQWNFKRMTQKGTPTVSSNKIVHYEKRALNYTLIFRYGSYEKIIGILFSKRG